MSRREDIDNASWTSDLLPLSSDAKLIAVWSTTNEHCNMAGLYRIDTAVIRFELALPPKRFEQAFEEVQRLNWLRYDGAVLYVPNRVSRLGSRNPNVARSIRRDLEQLEGHPWRHDFLEKYGEVDWLCQELSEIRSGKPNLKRVSEPFANPSETHSGQGRGQGHG